MDPTASLSLVEQRYTKTDRESLAIIWAAEHFRLYTIGTHCVVLTDHKPLESMFNKPTMQLHFTTFRALDA